MVLRILGNYRWGFIHEKDLNIIRNMEVCQGRDYIVVPSTRLFTDLLLYILNIRLLVHPRDRRKQVVLIASGLISQYQSLLSTSHNNTYKITQAELNSLK